MKVCITGASGLLGGCLAAELEGRAEVVAVGHGQPARAGTVKVKADVSDQAQVDRLIDGQGFTHVVHSAALRSPDECEADFARAYQVNVVSTEYIAEACRRNNCFLLYVSSDYIFSGTKPPYREDGPADPINIYGRTKASAEFAARSVPKHLITRIPALWGSRPDDPKANQAAFIAQLRKGEPFTIEGSSVRHFTLADDVAKAMAFCLEKGVEGTLGLAARESQTKADYVRALARLHGLDPALVLDGGLPPNSSPRPHDTTMDMSRYDALGGPVLRGVSQVVSDFLS